MKSPTPQKIGLVQHFSGVSSLLSEFEGLVGIGPRSPVLSSLLSSLENAPRMVGVYLSASDDESTQSKFSFGGFEPNHIRSGDAAIKWHDCIQADSATSLPYWVLSAGTMRLGDLDFGGAALEFVVDTGSSLIGVPAWMATSIYELTGANDDGSIECRRIRDLPSFTVVIGNTNYTLGPQEYALRSGWFSCHVGFVSSPVNRIILGDSFLLSYYSIFSMERPKELLGGSSNVHNWVGLAPVKPPRTPQNFPGTSFIYSRAFFVFASAVVIVIAVYILEHVWKRCRQMHHEQSTEPV